MLIQGDLYLTYCDYARAVSQLILFFPPLEAPIVISSAGLYNTFERLLKPEISQKSYYSDICRQLKPGIAAMNVFLGFNASNEELNLKARNIWAFPTNDSEKGFMEYLDLSVEEALDAKVPLMFVSFPSAKDPNW